MTCFNLQAIPHCTWLSVTSVALLLSACATTPNVSPSVQYQCDRGAQLRVTFNHKNVSVVRGGRGGYHRVEKRTTGATILLADGTAITLPAQKVASGFMLSNGQHTLRGKGNEATWAVTGMAVEECVVLKQ